MPIISSLDDLQAIQFIFPIRRTEIMESFVIEIQTLTLYLYRLLQPFNVQFLADMSFTITQGREARTVPTYILTMPTLTYVRLKFTVRLSKSL